MPLRASNSLGTACSWPSCAEQNRGRRQPFGRNHLLRSLSRQHRLTLLQRKRHSLQAALAARKTTPTLREALREASQPRAVPGLYRGLTASLGRAALSPAVFLLVYEQQKSGQHAVVAGMVARAVHTIVLQPLEFLRVNRQAGVLLTSTAQVQYMQRSVWDMLVSDGGKSFWRGGIATLARDVPASGIFWASYLTMQKATSSEGSRSSPIQAAGFASVSAAAAAALTQPFDVVKTRMQVHHMVTSRSDGYRKVRIPRFFATLRLTFKAGGLAGLWTGGLARCGSAAFAGGLLGPFFEYGQLLAEDAERPVRQAFYLPPDTTNTIVHPRSQRAMFIDVK